MAPYYLIRTVSLGTEEAVASEIRAMGYDAWAPFEVRGYRVTRRMAVYRHREYPILPRGLLAAIPEAAHGDLQRIRDFDCIQRDTALAPVKIPANHIRIFRDRVVDWNERELRRINAGNRGKPAKKAWRRIDPDSLPGIMATLFGTPLDAGAV